MQAIAPISIHLTPIHASAALALHIGQHVRHRDYKGRRVAGRIQGLTIDPEQGLMAHAVLDEPIVIPADQYGPEVRNYHIHAPAHEFTPLDDRDELMAEMLDVLQTIVRQCGAQLNDASGNSALLAHTEAVIAKVAGSAA